MLIAPKFVLFFFSSFFSFFFLFSTKLTDLQAARNEKQSVEQLLTVNEGGENATNSSGCISSLSGYGASSYINRENTATNEFVTYMNLSSVFISIAKRTSRDSVTRQAVAGKSFPSPPPIFSRLFEKRLRSGEIVFSERIFV